MKKKTNTPLIQNLSTKSIALLVVYLVIASFTVWQFLLPFKAERHFRDGYNFHMMKRYKYAIEELETAIKYAPWESHYMVQLGRSYEEYAKRQPTKKRKVEYWLKLVDLYKHMMTLDDRNPWFQNRLAIVYEELRRLVPEKSKDYAVLVHYHTQKAAELDSRNPLFQLNFASFLHRNGLHDDAIKYYEKVIEFDGRMVAARYNLADIYRKRGDMDKVMELYLEAHKIDPSFGNLNLALASEFLKKNEKDKAVPYLEGAIEQKPKQLEPLKTLGSIYYQKQDWDNVIRVYKKIVDLFPDQYTFHQFYIQGLVKTKRIKEAMTSLEAHIKKHPKDKVAKQQYRQIANALSKAK